MAKPPTPSPPANRSPAPTRAQPRGHAARLWLLGLLVLAGVGTAGALFVRFQLDSVREVVAREAQTRTGTPISFDSLTTNGLRGIRIENLSLELPAGDGPRVSLRVPMARIDIDFVEMLAGRLDIERLHADNAHIIIERPEEGSWLGSGPRRGGPAMPGLGSAAFRVTGKGCTLELRNIVGDTSLTLTDLAVDVSRQRDADAIQARLGASINGDDTQRLEVTALYTALDAFFVQAACTGIDAGDVNVFLPASQHFVTAGTVRPQVRIDAFPGNPVVVHLHTPLEGLALRDQPDFIGSANGSLTILAQYHVDEARLEFTAAEANTDQVSGSLRGAVRLDGPHPAFDLRLIADDIPLAPIAAMLLPGGLDDYGELKLDIEEPASVDLRLTGDTEAPLYQAVVRIAGGRLGFQARNANFPSGELVLGHSEIVWDPAAQVPSGTLRVIDGTVDSRLAKIRAERLAATLVLSNGEAIVDPLTFETGGSRFVGRAAYPISGGPAVFSVRGALPRLEDTLFHDLVANLSLSGVIAVDGRGVFDPGRSISFEATLEATQARVGYEWWFLKPPGIALQAGFTGQFDLATNAGGEFTIDGDVASSKAVASFRFANHGEKLALTAIDGEIPLLDVATVGKCVVFPYHITGGKGTAGRFTWRRVGSRDGENTWSLEALLDELALLPEGGVEPIAVRGAHVHLESQNYPERLNRLRITADTGIMPRFGELWFIGIDREDPRWADVEEGGEDRDWRFAVTVGELTVPPWRGHDFEGEIHLMPEVTALPTFTAGIGEGWLKGSYREDTVENHFRLVLDWEAVPVEMFLEHLELPPALTGVIDGELVYEMDRDDPATRLGQGRFTARHGYFGTEFLAGILGGAQAGDTSLLPTALSFSSFSSQVAFESDVVRTPDVRLESTQLRAEGRGQFIYDGDMDYEIRVSITPETASQIPALRDAFNIEGLRLAQQNIDLAFRVSGPMFNPQGSLQQLPPVSVALVSGALGITTEVMDMPRKILFDLLKLGGGIIATTR